MLRSRASVLVVVLLAVAPGSLFAQSKRDLSPRLTRLIESHRGDVAVAVKNLKTGETFYHREGEPMPTASLVKFPVMVECYRQAEAGKLKLDKMLTLQQADKVPGSGVLTKHFSAGAKISLRDAIRLMIAYSDNTATNLVLNEIGIASTGKTMETLGLPHTKIYAKVFRRDTSVDVDASRKFGLGSTTAKETVELYERLYANKLASKEFCDEMRAHLYACEDREKLARELPDGVKFAHKGGAVSTVRCDAGVMETPAGPIAVCVLTRNNRDQSWSSRNAAHRLCGEIGRRVYRHFNPPAARPAFTGVLKSGDSGEMVEALQRTLNARMNPSPELTIDGEFGPSTKAAVEKFQEANKLASNGNVGSETWKALGPLMMRRSPTPDPETVNSEKLKRAPADSLDGPPLVTCKAWAIADAKTGKVLWNENADRQLDIASTTKMMTAYIVTQLATKNPKLLDEVVVYSERADNTPGSTSGLNAGERTTVREVLYGLMLPSGNDASVALGEHFGGRLAKKDAAKKDGEKDPYDSFIAEMNATAKRLGMSGTQYRNTHGLTARGHYSCAADLVKLAHAALQNDLFRHYVNTRQHGVTVTGKGGYRRNVVWKNTNQLLGVDGFSGVKTGTTSAAGACLVSHGQRGGRSLIVVVLGAVASPARYTDSRNLYRWAWRQK